MSFSNDSAASLTTNKQYFLDESKILLSAFYLLRIRLKENCVLLCARANPLAVSTVNPLTASLRTRSTFHFFTYIPQTTGATAYRRRRIPSPVYFAAVMSTQGAKTIFEATGQMQTDERTTASVRVGSEAVDRRLTDRWEGVAMGEEAAKFTYDSAVVARPNRTNMHLVNRLLSGVALPSESAVAAELSSFPAPVDRKAEQASRRPLQACAVQPSVNVSSLMLLERGITRLESSLRGVNYISAAILDMERCLAGYEDNQQAVRRSLDAIEGKTETLHQQVRRRMGRSLNPEGAATMCRRMEVLAALAPAINSARANTDALAAVVSEWPEVKRGAEMVVASLEEHEATLNAVEEDLAELEKQLDSTERSVAKSFDMFERELLQSAKRYL